MTKNSITNQFYFVLVVCFLWNTNSLALCEEEKRNSVLSSLNLKTAKENPFYNSQLIFPMNSQHSHSPSIVKLPNDIFLACWFHGSGEKGADDVVIQAATGTFTSYGEMVWNPPFVIADTPNFPDLNPVLFLDHQEKLWLAWSTILANESEFTLIKYKKSDSLKETLQEFNEHNQLHIYIPNFVNEFFMGFFYLVNHLPSFVPKLMAEVDYKNLEWFIVMIAVLIFLLLFVTIVWFKKSHWKFPLLKILCGALLLVGVSGSILVYWMYESLDDRYLYRMGWATRSQPLLLENETILFPLYSDSFSSSLIAITKDSGKTWKFSEPIIGFGNIQPSLVQKDDGTIVAFMRDNGYYGRIRVSNSFDQGKTWSPVQSTNILNPGSSIAVTELKSGNWVLVYNDLLKGKHRLKVSLSTDEGKTWRYHKYLETGEKYQSIFSYPTLLQTDDGMIHCVYSYHPTITEKSIKHTYFTESWLLSEPPRLTAR